MKQYIRDKRSPTPKNETVSRVMSANKAKNTKPEVLLRQTLWQEGLRGYRLHYKGVPGRPDIAYVKHQLAIFVNGCFWHRCPHCNYTLPKTNTPFWQNKFQKNIDRDRKKIAQLKALGWNVLTIWECELKSGLPKAVEKIKKALS